MATLQTPNTYIARVAYEKPATTTMGKTYVTVEVCLDIYASADERALAMNRAFEDTQEMQRRIMAQYHGDPAMLSDPIPADFVPNTPQPTAPKAIPTQPKAPASVVRTAPQQSQREATLPWDESKWNYGATQIAKGTPISQVPLDYIVYHSKRTGKWADSCREYLNSAEGAERLQDEGLD